MTRRTLPSAFRTVALCGAALATVATAHSQAAEQLGQPQPVAPSADAHSIVAVVNDDIVSSHDLRQRVLFLLATTGAARDEASLARLQQQALNNLVDERLQLQESNKYDQTISDAQIDRNVARLITRNDLEPEEVAQRLAQVGVGLGTLRDQVRSEIAWQGIVNGLFGSRIRISDAQIDETLSRLSANVSKPAYRVAEIYIEATPDIGGMDGAMEGARAMITQINEGAPFPLLARQFSSAPSAAKGGDVGLVREGELRPELNAALATVPLGTVSEPIPVPGGVYVIAVLDKQVSEADTVYRINQVNMTTEAGGGAEGLESRFIEFRDQLQSCETLEDQVDTIEGLNFADMGEIKDSDMDDTIRESLSGLAVGELSAPILTEQGAVALMVCEREITGTGIPTRKEIEDRLTDQQLAQASRRHLRDLRRNASIVTR